MKRIRLHTRAHPEGIEADDPETVEEAWSLLASRGINRVLALQFLRAVAPTDERAFRLYVIARLDEIASRRRST